MYHQADGRDDNQHHHGNGIQHDSHVDVQLLGERQPVDVPRGKGRVGSFGCPFGCKIAEGRQVAQYSYGSQGEGTDSSGHAVRHLHACQRQHQKAE